MLQLEMSIMCSILALIGASAVSQDSNFVNKAITGAAALFVLLLAVALIGIASHG